MTHRIVGVRKVCDWIRLLYESNGVSEQWIRNTYGDAPEIVKEQKCWYQKILSSFSNIYNTEAEVIIARAPARVNLVGMHIDHRGGHVNPIAAKEMVIVAEARNDDYVVIHDIEPERFPPRQFRISEELPEERIEDWPQWTELQNEKAKNNGTAGDWGNYVKAVGLYLQELHRDSSGRYIKKLRGMNALSAGNIPIAAGLGSSSALVVASAEAFVRINNLDIKPEEFVSICGAAEWYVGTRGGSGDHAAIKLSKKGHISNIGFFPLQIDFAPFTDGYRVAICNTLKEAKKAAGAKSIFNERVATYEIGLMLLFQKFPHLEESVQYLRDLNTEHLGVDESQLYEMLKSLPVWMNQAQLREQLPQEAEKLEELFRTHDEPKDGYRIRGVCLFGLAECARGKAAAEFLKKGKMKAFGELISISHNGDRVTCMINGKRCNIHEEITDEYLDRLINDLHSDDESRVKAARLYRQPGDYAVSCEELDELADIALSVEGVLGAGRTGAGLGGCISVLIAKDKTDELIKQVSERYYNPRNLPLGVEICFPVEGSGIIEI